MQSTFIDPSIDEVDAKPAKAPRVIKNTRREKNIPHKAYELESESGKFPRKNSLLLADSISGEANPPGKASKIDMPHMPSQDTARARYTESYFATPGEPTRQTLSTATALRDYVAQATEEQPSERAIRKIGKRRRDEM